MTVDITGAYLNADMSKSEVHMRLDKCHAEILWGLDPSYKKFTCRHGTVVVRAVTQGIIWVYRVGEVMV